MILNRYLKFKVAVIFLLCKVAVEYVKLCGYKNGEIGNERKKEDRSGLPKLTLDEIAKQLGMSKTNLKRALSKDLIETNIRQRGIGNTNQRKMGLCIKELDRIYGIREGSANKKGDNRIGEGNNFTDQSLRTESDLLKSLGINVDKRTIQNYKKLTEMIPELEELVDTGIATPTTALDDGVISKTIAFIKN